MKRTELEIVRAIMAALMQVLDKRYFEHEKKCMEFLDGYSTAICDLGRIDLGDIAEKELYPKEECNDN